MHGDEGHLRSKNEAKETQGKNTKTKEKGAEWNNNDIKRNHNITRSINSKLNHKYYNCTKTQIKMKLNLGTNMRNLNKSQKTQSQKPRITAVPTAAVGTLWWHTIPHNDIQQFKNVFVQKFLIWLKKKEIKDKQLLIQLKYSYISASSVCKSFTEWFSLQPCLWTLGRSHCDLPHIWAGGSDKLAVTVLTITALCRPYSGI